MCVKGSGAINFGAELRISKRNRLAPVLACLLSHDVNRCQLMVELPCSGNCTLLLEAHHVVAVRTRKFSYMVEAMRSAPGEMHSLNTPNVGDFHPKLLVTANIAPVHESVDTIAERTVIRHGERNEFIGFGRPRMY